MSCGSRKINKVSIKSKRSLSKKNQRGGVSNACVLDYTNDKASYNASGAGAANIHNLNPQASLDLDSKFMSYGEPVPLEQSGGSKCGDSGVGTSRPKTETFKKYIKNLDADLTFRGGSNCGSHNDKQKGGSNCGSHNDKQKGSGYTVDPSQYIAGHPMNRAYDDNSPPAIIGGIIVNGQPDKAVCGNGALNGGGKAKKSKKSKKSKSQRGGDFTSIGSKPADYSTAFDGSEGMFKYPDDMMTRDFGGKQPNYGVDTI